MRDTDHSFGIVNGPDAAGLRARLAHARVGPAQDEGGGQLAVYDSARALVAHGARAILLPCFASHAFIDALRAELPVPVIDLFTALRAHLDACAPVPRRIGMLGVPRDWPAHRLGVGRTVIHAGAMPAAAACRALLARGVDVIVPASAGYDTLGAALRAQGFPVVDVNGVYAQYAATYVAPTPPRIPARIGIVGGVGPAATVDFIDKIVRNTPAASDQEHLKLVLEQNPQIPDRSAHLAGRGADPTLALYAACRKLQDAGAGMIAIPCNTAHAYVAAIRARLDVPVVDMLGATAAEAHARLAPGAAVGLLATDGTVHSHLYHAALERAGLRALVPDAAHQRLVMDAIYGADGIKAGRAGARCRATLLAVLDHLTARGATAAILGCTELPMVLRGDATGLRRYAIPLLDPTDILARACVARALA